MSASAGKTLDTLESVTVTLDTTSVMPVTLMVDGYGSAGPLVCPMGISMVVVLENVAVAACATGTERRSPGFEVLSVCASTPIRQVITRRRAARLPQRVNPLTCSPA